MRKRRIIPTLPVNFFEDTDNKTKYQKMLYSSILDGVEQTLENGKPSFIMMRVDDGRNLKDVSVLKDSFKSNLETCLDFYEQVVIYKSLLDEQFLGLVIDHMKPEYFNDKNIRKVFSIIKNFYRNILPKK